MVNEGGRCVGIITEEDLILTGEDADLHLPHYFQLFGGFVFLERWATSRSACARRSPRPPADLMTEHPVTIEPSSSVEEAARVIARKKHNRLPVVEHGRLVGVVTRLDVLEALTKE